MKIFVQWQTLFVKKYARQLKAQKHQSFMRLVAWGY